MELVEMPVALARRPGEPQRWYGRFVRYALQEPELRSLLAVYRSELEARKGAQQREKARTLPAAWREQAARWEWRRRASEADYEQTRRRLVEAERERREMLARQIKFGQALQGKAVEWLRLPSSRLTSPGDVIKFIELGVKLERSALGLPVELLGVAELSDNELVERYQRVWQQFHNESEESGD